MIHSIDHNLLLQIRLEILVVILCQILKQAQHLFLELLFSLRFVDIDASRFNFGQRIQMSQLVGGLVCLEIVSILLFFGL